MSKSKRSKDGGGDGAKKSRRKKSGKKKSAKKKPAKKKAAGKSESKSRSAKKEARSEPSAASETGAATAAAAPSASRTASRSGELEFGPPARKEIDWIISRYPNKQAALLPVLRVAEREFDGIGPASIRLVARTLDLSPGFVYGVFTFYTQFRRSGEGKYILQVCATLSCALRGCRDIVHHLERRLKIEPGQTTPDRVFTLKKVECLGSCDTAPVVQINDDYHENLTIEELDRVLDGLAVEAS